MTEHTPGPWHVRPMRGDLSGAWLGTIAVGAKNQIAAVAVRELAEGEANARLIAAAPDLLRELKVMVDTYWGKDGDGGEPPTMIVEARAAIAKATNPTHGSCAAIGERR